MLKIIGSYTSHGIITFRKYILINFISTRHTEESSYWSMKKLIYVQKLIFNFLSFIFCFALRFTFSSITHSCAQDKPSGSHEEEFHSQLSTIVTTMTDQSLEKRVELARKELKAILKRMDNIRFTSKVFKFWHIYLQLRRPPKFQIDRKVMWTFIAFGFIFYYFVVNYINSVQYQKCLVDSPDIFRKIFRPAEDCSMCLGVQQVEKISNIDPDVFEERYAYSGVPVVITDATANWTASKVFSFPFFKVLYQDRKADCQFFPYQTGFKSLQDVFNMSQNRAMLKADTEAWYVGWSNCDEEIGVILRDHYDRPYFLPATAESEKTDWIFMGSPGYGAPMHVDDVDHPSWQAQIKGSKLWILEPPRECHYVCDRLSITVNSGEINTNRWYHQTKIISEDLSITIGAEYD